MPSFSSDVLPDQAGRNLGSAAQPWNVFAQNINVNGLQFTNNVTNVAFSATPTFTQSANAGFSITLTGNVTASSFSGTVSAGQMQFLFFRIVQDATGGRSFAWPANFFGGIVIDSTAPANATFHQLFIYDGTNAYAISPGSYY